MPFENDTHNEREAKIKNENKIKVINKTYKIDFNAYIYFCKSCLAGRDCDERLQTGNHYHQFTELLRFMSLFEFTFAFHLQIFIYLMFNDNNSKSIYIK